MYICGVAEPLRALDAEAIALFARKGCEGGPCVPQAGEANAVKLRRVLQLTRDLARRPFAELRILDLGCGEGVYAIEAALRGASVVAVDARAQRMEQGAAVAARHGLSRLRFEERDVRGVTRESHGAFDVVYGLGILYHLEAADAFRLLDNVAALCSGLLLVDTFVSLRPALTLEHRGRAYEGERRREHEDGDPPELRRSRVLRSIDNTFSFRFTRASLVRALRHAGFACVLECQAPLEPAKPEDRITLAACRGEAIELASYPWLNGLSEEEIERRLTPRAPEAP